jgi:hypothetical protein
VAHAQDSERRQTSGSLAELLEDLPDLWPKATVELQQELAAFGAVLAESPAFGGLCADPSSRGRLAFCRVASVRKTEDEITKKWISLV